jgi:hypothetical protein
MMSLDWEKPKSKEAATVGNVHLTNLASAASEPFAKREALVAALLPILAVRIVGTPSRKKPDIHVMQILRVIKSRTMYRNRNNERTRALIRYGLFEW